LTFVVVGGGATGVELAGSLHTLIHHGLLPTYPTVDPSEVRVILIEAGKALLNGMDPWLSEAATRRIQARGVDVRLGNPATEVTDAGIGFKDGQFVPSRTVVWAAGVRPSPLAAALPVERGRDGRLVVDQYLRVPSYPDVSVLGDCAWFPLAEQEGRPAPPNAQTAVRQAPVVAQNVAASLQHESPTPFHYKSEGNLVALGQGDGVALIGTQRLEGFPAWMTWRGYYLTQLIGFKNRLAVLIEWTSAYFGYRATARLDVGGLPSSPAAPPAPAPAAGAQTPAASSSASNLAGATATGRPPEAAPPDAKSGTERPPAAAPPDAKPGTDRPAAAPALAADAPSLSPRATARRKPPTGDKRGGSGSGKSGDASASPPAGRKRPGSRRKPPGGPERPTDQ
jgi:hypothetical protein